MDGNEVFISAARGNRHFRRYGVSGCDLERLPQKLLDRRQWLLNRHSTPSSGGFAVTGSKQKPLEKQYP